MTQVLRPKRFLNWFLKSFTERYEDEGLTIGINSTLLEKC